MWATKILKEHMGLTNWKNFSDGLIYKYDVRVAKNYLNEEELSKLNDLTNMFLVFAEDEAKERHITINDWIRKLMIYYNLGENRLLKIQREYHINRLP